MSDFDDEPTEGRRSVRRDADDVDDAPRSGRRSTSDRAEDDWDDEPVPARKRRAETAAEDDDWDDDDWDDDERGGGRRDLTLVFALIAAVAIIALVVVLTRPDDDTTDTNANANQNPPAEGQPADAPPNKNWVGDVGDKVGEMPARIAGEDGVFIWTDFDGWHVRSKRAGEVTVVVAAPKAIDKTGGEPKGEEATTVTVTLPGGGDGTTGADLDLVDSETASFTITEGGAAVPATDIKLGGGTGTAAGNPAEFTKE